jgi:uncharacterized protein (TIGR00369 family)
MDVPSPLEHQHPVIERMARRRAELGRSLSDTVGARMIAVSRGRAVVELDFAPHVQQLTGTFHAGALTTLADVAATAACLSGLPEDALDAPEKFPVSINFTINLVGNASSGAARAEAQVVHFGRTTQVVETRITSQTGRLLAVVLSTHLTLAGRGRTAEG